MLFFFQLSTVQDIINANFTHSPVHILATKFSQT